MKIYLVQFYNDVDNRVGVLVTKDKTKALKVCVEHALKIHRPFLKKKSLSALELIELIRDQKRFDKFKATKNWEKCLDIVESYNKSMFFKSSHLEELTLGKFQK